MCLLDEFIPEKEQRFKLKTKRDNTNDKKYIRGHWSGVFIKDRHKS
jgi:hypothetical protein